MPLIIDHPHVSAARTAIEFNNDVSKTTIIIETTLRLNTGDPDYDESAVFDLIRSVVQEIDKQGYGANLIRFEES